MQITWEPDLVKLWTNASQEFAYPDEDKMEKLFVREGVKMPNSERKIYAVRELQELLEDSNQGINKSQLLQDSL